MTNEEFSLRTLKLVSTYCLLSIHWHSLNTIRIVTNTPRGAWLCMNLLKYCTKTYQELWSFIRKTAREQRDHLHSNRNQDRAVTESEKQQQQCRHSSSSSTTQLRRCRYWRTGIFSRNSSAQLQKYLISHSNSLDCILLFWDTVGLGVCF